MIRVVERFAAQGVGVDIDPASLDAARTKAQTRGCESLTQFVEVDIREYKTDALFDCGICMGSTHAFAMDEPAYSESLQGLSKLVSKGGTLLIGESYWVRDPDAEYLDFIGEPIGTYRSHLENVEMAESLGLRPLYAITSTLDEWDDFEWRHHMRIEEQALENPDDPSAIERRDRGRAWRSAYLKWGRGTMGFGFYLFRNEQ